MDYRSIKPPCGLQINRGNSIGQGLICAVLADEYGGVPHDLVTGLPLSFVGSAGWAYGAPGVGINCLNSGDGAIATAGGLLRSITDQCTIAFRGRVYSGTTNFPPVFGVMYSLVYADPYTCYVFDRGSDGTKIRLVWNSGGIQNVREGTPTAFDGSERLYVGVIRGNSKVSELFENNGVSLSSGANNFGPTFTSTSTLVLGDLGTGSGSARNSNILFNYGLIWDRALSVADVQRLYQEPYCFLQPPPRIRKIVALTSFPLTQAVSDSVNNFADSVSTSIIQAANLGLLFGDQLSLNDGISLTGPPPDYFLLLGDSIANVQDSAAIIVELQKTFSDSVNNLADAFASMVGIPVEIFDSQQFNWADAISVGFEAPLSLTQSDSVNNYADFVSTVLGNVRIDISAADTINNLADAIRMYFLLQVVQGDNLVLSDSVQMRFNHLARIADALGITDAVLTDVGSRPNFSDSINNLNDAVSVALAAQHSLSVGDQINLTDAVALSLDGVYNQTGFIERVRRYLGDIQSS